MSAILQSKVTQEIAECEMCAAYICVPSLHLELFAFCTSHNLPFVAGKILKSYIKCFCCLPEIQI